MGTTRSSVARAGSRSRRVPGLLTLAGTAALVAVIGAIPAGAKAPGDDNASGHGKDHKVTLCHATHSFTNPYVVITVDYHSVTQGGHGRHDGPVFRADLPSDVHWGDIIPPFDLGGDASYEGKNWTTEGQALFDHGCTTSESPTTVTTTAPSTTVAPTTMPSTTMAPSTTVPSTTTAPTTSTTAPSTTTTTEASTTTTTEASTTTTTESTTTTTGGPGTESVDTTVPGTARVLGVSVARPATPSTTTPVVQVLGDTVTRPASGSLPVTGSSLALFLAGLGLVGAGTFFAAASRRRRLA